MASGSSVLITSLFDTLVKELQKGNKVEETSKKFAKLGNDEERVQYLFSLPETEQAITAKPISNCKCDQTAASLRNEGNKLFQKKNIPQALDKYTKSIANALLPDPDTLNTTKENHLALAIGNRSAALFHLKEYDQCLKDIDFALESGYPKDLQYKVYERKAKCLAIVGDLPKAIEALMSAKSLSEYAKVDNKKKEQIQKDLEKQIDLIVNNTQSPDKVRTETFDSSKHLPDTADGRHDIFTSLSGACEVTYTEHQGRFITANRDIAPGEIILVEKPYASVLLEDQIRSHCDRCYKVTMAPLPCRQCPNAMFCSGTCRDEAWSEYHQLECKIMGLIYKSGVGKFGHLALRTISKFPLSFWLEFRRKVNSGAFKPESKCYEGCSENGKYESTNYNTIYKLVTHDNDRAVHDLFRRAVTAVFLCNCLEVAGFFSAIQEHEETLDQAKAFIGGLILSHLQLMPCNAHEINELRLDRKDVVNSALSELGAGIYSTLSLFNHSCDPTVNRNFIGDTCIVRAIKAIPKGEEVSDNYGAVYAVQTLQERQEKLTPQYYFTCQCEACKNNWPLFPNIQSKNPRWKCPSCKTSLLESTGVCNECKTKHQVDKLQAQLNKSQEVFKASFDNLLACNAKKAQVGLCKHLLTLQKLLNLPWLEFNTCQEALKQCFSIQSNINTSNLI